MNRTKLNQHPIQIKSSRFLDWVLLFSLVLTLPTSLQAEEKKLKVIASFSIAADLVKQVGGDQIELITLVGPNSDGHLYQPTAQDSMHLSQADIVFINGLGFEGWIERLIKASGFAGEPVYLSRNIKPIYWDSTPDPHAWQSIDNIQSYVDIIQETLMQQDSVNQKIYQQNADQYREQLDSLKQEFADFCLSLDTEQRRLVTSHDAFTYFGRACDIQFFAPQGISTEDEPGAQEIAQLIQQIKSQKIPAVFIENMTNPKLIEQIQRETGAIFGGKLYSDALSEEQGPANTYLNMMRYNLQTIKTALIKAKQLEVK
jgi:zinc/manganese transport system substrate-binding protein